MAAAVSSVGAVSSMVTSFLQGVAVIGFGFASIERGRRGRSRGARQVGGEADAPGHVLVDRARDGVPRAGAQHDVADEIGVAVGGRRQAEHRVELGSFGVAGPRVRETDVLGALALPHVGEHRLAGERRGSEEAEVVVGQLVGDAECDADLVEAVEDVGGCRARSDRAEPEREGHAVDRGLELGDAQRLGAVGPQQLRPHVEQLARDRALECGGRLEGQPVPHGTAPAREQREQCRVEGEVAGEEPGGHGLALGRGIRDTGRECRVVRSGR